MPDPTPHELSFPYRRSLGPVIGAFLQGLREKKVLGARTAAGRVLVPPLEYDPETGEPTEGLVEVGSEGEVTGATHQPAPSSHEPLDAPFAWALVRLDGADTSIFHAVDAPAPPAIGTRVRIRWRAERRGHITDIECFEEAR